MKRTHPVRPEPSRGALAAHPQPLAMLGEQRREGDIEQEELEAAREWLRHVEAGRIAGGQEQQ